MESYATPNETGLRQRLGKMDSNVEDMLRKRLRSGEIDEYEAFLDGAGDSEKLNQSFNFLDTDEEDEVNKNKIEMKELNLKKSVPCHENVPLISAIVGDDSDMEEDVEVTFLIQDKEDDENYEKTSTIFFQILGPFFVAGFGMVLAGLVLDAVQHWPVYVDITELFVVVPALLGLKGNLEMTLASRLSTASNVGNLDGSNLWKVIYANLALIQCQAVVVGFLASSLAITVGALKYGHISWPHTLLLCGASCATASMASLVLGVVMTGVILFCKKYQINPDNIATPIAAALGDVTTLAILSSISVYFYKYYTTENWMIAPALTLSVVWFLVPLWISIAWNNESTKPVLIHGWLPVVSSMLISSGAGSILEQVLSSDKKYFTGIAVFQPVMNGVAGNLVAVQASRISTFLHKNFVTLGNLSSNVKVMAGPLTVFGKQGGIFNQHCRSARVLLSLVVPGHMVFIFAIVILNAGHSSITPRFVAFYLSAALLQVAILLVITHWITYFLWKIGQDPDTSAIPYLTALGDLSGTTFLSLAFFMLYLVGDQDADVGD